MAGMTLSPGHHLYDRIDLVVCTLGDEVTLSLIEGTPDPTPFRPEVPDHVALVAEVRVPAAALTVDAGDIESHFNVGPTYPPTMAVDVPWVDEQ